MWNSNIPGTTGVSDSRPHPSDILRDGSITRIFRERILPDWDVDLRVSETLRGPDAILSLRPTTDINIAVLIEAKNTVEPRDIPRLIDQLNSYDVDGRFLVVAPYLSPRTREALVARNINFADLTGNMRFVLDNPFIYIHDRGASTDPWRENRSVHSLKGPAAGRVVRALCDFRPPYGVRALSARASIPVASVSRIVQLLQREALIVRTDAGEVVEVHWKDLIQRWVEDYGFSTSNRVTGFFDPRGPQESIRRLEEVAIEYAITGSFAAALVAPYAPPRLATIYTDNVDDLALDMGIRPVSSSMNVILARPFDPVVFERTRTVDGHTYAGLSQVAADLMTSPGRAPSEAEELLRWMEEHEDAWRI